MSRMPSPSVSVPPHVFGSPLHSPDAQSLSTLHGSPSSFLHTLLQPSPVAVLPSSHASPCSTWPLPQVSAGSHVPEPGVSHVFELHWLSPVHGSPFESLQLFSQPSPVTVLPSSHASLPSRTPLPHWFAG